MDSLAIDALDRAILDELASDGRISWRELGERVGLGATATADRVRRLVDGGAIVRFTTVVDPAVLGIAVRAVVDLRLQPGTDPDAFERHLSTQPEVTEAFHVTGPFDYELVVACPDVPTLDDLLRGWKRDRWVRESNTRLIMGEIDLTGLRETTG